MDLGLFCGDEMEAREASAFPESAFPIARSERGSLDSREVSEESCDERDLELFARRGKKASSSYERKEALSEGGAEEMRSLTVSTPCPQPLKSKPSKLNSKRRTSVFQPHFPELRRVMIACTLATDMELFRQHNDAMRRCAQSRQGGSFLRRAATVSPFDLQPR